MPYSHQPTRDAVEQMRLMAALHGGPGRRGAHPAAIDGVVGCN